MGYNGPAPKKEIMIGGPLDGTRQFPPVGGGRNTIVWRSPETGVFHIYRWSGAVWEYRGAKTGTFCQGTE